ncbi:xanthine dehydrogenase family protein subunit M [Candidatus Bipolaricaulota bacterium]|nr:xanthine dehydrogenase family protein subunit M [Candidatus Bipolaricaulota bacterium]
MTVPAFNYLKPDSLAEALDMLATEPGAYPIAGGTNLMVDVRAGKLSPETMIDVGDLDELRGIVVKDSQMTIGGAVTIAELLRHEIIRQRVPVLFAAGKTFANTLIRNRATVGGNLVNAAPCSDTAPALLVLDAEVSLSSSSGTRWIPLTEFLVGAFQTQRRADELLMEVRFPIPPASSRGGFEKMGLRKISCMAKVDVAVMADFDERGACKDARIALGAVAPIPLRAEKAEASLVGTAFIARAPEKPVRCGEQVQDKTIEEAARLAGEAASPRSGSEYKRQVVYGLTRRILTAMATGIRDGEAS